MQSTGSAPSRPSPCVSPTAVVVLPSPFGVGVIAVTQTSFPSGRSASRSSTPRSTLPLWRPYGCSSSGSQTEPGRDLFDRPHRRGLCDLQARHRCAGWRFRARRATTVGRMALVAIPQPYDFDLSTERFRAFGQDLACRWHEGALHRIVRGREVRIAAAPGGVEVDPHDAGIGAEVRLLLGIPFDLDAFAAWAAREDATLRGGRRPPARLPAAAPARPVGGARHVDHGAAGLAPRRVRDPRPARRALRRPPRARLGVPEPGDPRRGAGGGDRRRRLLAPEGGVPRRAGTLRPRPGGSGGASGRRGARDDHGASAGSASGRPTGSSPVTWPGRTRGRRATSRYARRSPSSTVTAAGSRPRRCDGWASASPRSRI